MPWDWRKFVAMARWIWPSKSAGKEGPFDWREFLELARVWKDRSGAAYSAEAANRASVSRAYYAAFCHTRNYAENKLGFRRTRTSKEHSLLRDYLMKLKNPPWPEVAEKLDELRKWRNQCYYDDEVSDVKRIVSDAITTAEEIVQQCRP